MQKALVEQKSRRDYSMFLFELSNYDDLSLYAEVKDLLRQRLEASSRQAIPVIWKITDRVNAYADKKPSQENRRVRYRIYGIILLALGIFALVPGLVEPRTPALILAGGFAAFIGILQIILACRKSSQDIPASCQKEAAALWEGRRAVDWSKAQQKIVFDETGMKFCPEAAQETISYDSISDIFETEHLWLMIYTKDKALLLQKRDLTIGEPDTFSSYILRKISADS